MADEASIGARIEALGFIGDAAQVFDLVPLVHVAWADGRIQKDERFAIVGVARARGINGGSAGMEMLEGLLERAPSKTFLDESLGILRDLAEHDPERTKTLVTSCVNVARMDGGFFGVFGDAVDESERKALEHIATELGGRAHEWLLRTLR